MNEKDIVNYYNSGYSVRSTATYAGIDRKQVSKILSDAGVEIRYQRKPVEYVGVEHIRCSDCKTVKHLNEVPFSTSNSREGYYFSYCKECRKRRQRKNRLARDGWVERAGRIRLRAEKNNLEFDLTPEYLKGLFQGTNGECFYTDVPMTIEFGEGLKPTALSVDRIQHNRGYVQGNVVLCTHRANTIKNNMGLDELKLWIPEWHRRLCNVGLA